MLKRASPEDEVRIIEAIGLAVDEFPRLLSEGAEKVMNRLHGRPAPERNGERG